MADTDTILKEIKDLRLENKRDHETITGKIHSQGERIVRVETQVIEMKPQIAKARDNASWAKDEATGIKGQWKTIAAITGGVALAVLGALARGLIG